MIVTGVAGLVGSYGDLSFVRAVAALCLDMLLKGDTALHPCCSPNWYMAQNECVVGPWAGLGSSPPTTIIRW